jgi:hypothetical protein
VKAVFTSSAFLKHREGEKKRKEEKFCFLPRMVNDSEKFRSPCDA